MGIKSLQNRVRGWFPKEPRLVYASKAAKPRLRKPAWIAFTLISILVLSSAVFVGARAAIRYSNPQADVTASYFEKSLNCSTATVGDTVEVTFRVYWHGYVLPEFKRQVQIIDPFPENTFQLVSGNNTCQYSGYGGGDQYRYILRVISNDGASVELPQPRLYLDNTEIPLNGQPPRVELK
jgi:hypothetical protein